MKKNDKTVKKDKDTQKKIIETSQESKDIGGVFISGNVTGTSIAGRDIVGGDVTASKISSGDVYLVSSTQKAFINGSSFNDYIDSVLTNHMDEIPPDEKDYLDDALAQFKNVIESNKFDENILSFLYITIKKISPVIAKDIASGAQRFLGSSDKISLLLKSLL